VCQVVLTGLMDAVARITKFGWADGDPQVRAASVSNLLVSLAQASPP